MQILYVGVAIIAATFTGFGILAASVWVAQLPGVLTLFGGIAAFVGLTYAAITLFKYVDRQVGDLLNDTSSETKNANNNFHEKIIGVSYLTLSDSIFERNVMENYVRLELTKSLQITNGKNI